MTLALSLFFLWLGLVLMEKLNPNVGQKQKYVLLILLLPIVIYPFEYGPVWWLRGLTGDLSITSLCLLAMALFKKLDGLSFVDISVKEKCILMRFIVVVGLIFYPLALGLTSFDPYSLGYQNMYGVGVVLGLTLMIFLSGYTVMATMLIFAVLAWDIQLLQSVNLWDYLLDPFVFFYALGSVVRCKI